MSFQGTSKPIEKADPQPFAAVRQERVYQSFGQQGAVLSTTKQRGQLGRKLSVKSPDVVLR